LNLKRKVVLKRSLKKKKKKKQNLAGSPFGPARPAGPASHPAPARLSLSFSFLLLSLTPGPHLSASPSSLPFLPPLPRRPAAASRADPAAPRLLPFLFLPSELAN
jgi:hypothetical protein